jgi:hypothetical protein
MPSRPQPFKVRHNRRKLFRRCPWDRTRIQVRRSLPGWKTGSICQYDIAEDLKRLRQAMEGAANQAESVTPSAPPSTADEIKGIFGNIAQGMGEAAHENAVDRFKRDGAMTYRQPDAVRAAKSDPRYNTRDNPDGSVEVVGLLDPRTNEWVGQAPGTANAPESAAHPALTDGYLSPDEERAAIEDLRAGKNERYVRRRYAKGDGQNRMPSEHYQRLAAAARGEPTPTVKDSLIVPGAQPPANTPANQGAPETTPDQPPTNSICRRIRPRNYKPPRSRSRRIFSAS